MGIFSGGGSAQAVQKAGVTLTNAQIRTLATAELIAAPGVGKAIFCPAALGGSFSNASPGYYTPLAFVQFDWTANYTNIDPTAQLTFVYGATQPMTGYLAEQGGFLDWGGDAIWTPGANDVGNAGTFPITDLANVENVAVNVGFTNASAGDFTGGNAANRIRVTAYYTVMDLI